jgi:DNA polymerase V
MLSKYTVKPLRRPMLTLVPTNPPATTRAKATPITLVQTPEPLIACLPGFDIPQFVSRLSAGFPSPATDYMEEGLDLNTFLVRHKAATFAFAVKGNSMRDAGIVDGDKVLVDRSVEPKHGQIVVAVVNGDYTIKRLHLVEGRVELHAENPEFLPRKFQEGEQLEVWGVVVGVIRRYAC